MIEKQIFYRVVDHDKNMYYRLTTIWDINDEPKLIAQDAAHDFFVKHNGWEAS